MRDLLLECVEAVVVLNVLRKLVFVFQNHKQNIKSFQFMKKKIRIFLLASRQVEADGFVINAYFSSSCMKLQCNAAA